MTQGDEGKEGTKKNLGPSEYDEYFSDIPLAE